MLMPLYYGDDLNYLYLINPVDDSHFQQKLEKLRNDFWEEKTIVVSDKNISEQDFINSIGDSQGLRDATSIGNYANKHGV